MRTIAENRSLLLKKAKWISDQKHFDGVMELFPVELRQEIYLEVKPLLKAPLVLNLPPSPITDRTGIGIAINKSKV